MNIFKTHSVIYGGDFDRLLTASQFVENASKQEKQELQAALCNANMGAMVLVIQHREHMDVSIISTDMLEAVTWQSPEALHIGVSSGYSASDFYLALQGKEY